MTSRGGGSSASNIGRRASAAGRRLSTETKAAYKTTELAVFVAVSVLVLIASWVVGTSHDGIDHFRADKAWWYITLLAIGYMVSRGLAKSGSKQFYDESDSSNAPDRSS